MHVFAKKRRRRINEQEKNFQFHTHTPMQFQKVMLNRRISFSIVYDKLLLYRYFTYNSHSICINGTSIEFPCVNAQRMREMSNIIDIEKSMEIHKFIVLFAEFSGYSLTSYVVVFFSSCCMCELNLFGCHILKYDSMNRHIEFYRMICDLTNCKYKKDFI